MSFLDGLLPASFRGVPFFTNSVSTRVGRKTAVHEYYGRDTIWVEDLGRGVRSFGFRGFLAGALVPLQQAAMLLAMEKPGPGTLTHPSLGIFTCSLVNFSSVQSDDAMGIITLDMEFLETGVVEFPTNAAASGGISIGSLNALNASSSAYILIIGQGAAILSQLHNTVSAWVNLPLAIVADASVIVNGVTSLAGVFGRYMGGKGSPAAPLGSTVQTLLITNQTARAAIATATAAAIVAPDAATAAATVQAVTASAAAAITSPADQVRVLSAMAAFAPITPTDGSAVGLALAATEAATSALCRQASLAVLATSCAAYVPTSYDDAVSLRSQVVALFDAEISIITDIATSTAFRLLLSAVVNDLTARGGSLAPLQTVTLGASLSAFVVAQLLYQDGLRADDLAVRVNPVHPAFMPPTFRAPAY